MHKKQTTYQHRIIPANPNKEKNALKKVHFQTAKWILPNCANPITTSQTRATSLVD